ncbi:hypothetical protein L211DRAFT_433053 [Terfezia boudieri ATCC MYA-4762]|uniref:Uncharacterized protein n=1 Tax=Terfezia boudieri ATCC MYA-4762 TaxID=1051890 RepID=A0A3N4LEW6_9PEZI|nr:hypothetical protein L211DRAFT_433053 [Terfezia boudieri ATCC MYA-4762]
MADPAPPEGVSTPTHEPWLASPASETEVPEAAAKGSGAAAEPSAGGGAAAAAAAAAPFLAASTPELPAAAQKRKKPKKSSEHVDTDTNNNVKNNNNNNNDDDDDDDDNGNNTTEAGDAQLPSSSATEQSKKMKKRSPKNKSPADDDTMDTARISANAEENASSNDASSSENRAGGGVGIPRARGFTAVNLPVASAKPAPAVPEDLAVEQLLNESAAAAAAAEKDADGDVTMDVTAPSATKKQKRKRKDKNAPAEGEDEQESVARQSAKKRRNKDQPVDLTDDLPETQVPATQENEQQIDTAPGASGNQGDGEDDGDQGGEEEDEEEEEEEEEEKEEEAVVPTKQNRPRKVKNASPAEDDTQSPMEPASGDPESVPATQPEDVSAREATPRPPPPPISTHMDSSPAMIHTPKPKSKVAIAYERKRKRLEAAAAASSPTHAQTTADGGDGMDLDVPNEEDEDVLTSTPTLARETPKTNKRKKRRMPDLNTPFRPTGDEHASRHSDDEAEGEGGAIGSNNFEPSPSHTPGKKAARKAKTPKTPKTPKPISTATPQPGTTALSRKRASYTYAPDPIPANPPSTGTFTQPECSTIDDYLQNFARQNQLSEKQLISRIWGDTSVVPTQTKAERESFWKDLYELFPHRKRLAIYNHVRRRYHNFDVQGAKWDEEQDAALAKMVEEMGKKWTNIGRSMGRLPDDCRDRWRNYVKCGQGRREKEWTEEEEAKLREVVGQVREALRQAAEARSESLEAEVEPNWTVVSERMGGWRSRIQCRYKWSKMLEWEGKARLPDEEGGEGAEGENGVRRVKTPRKRALKKSTATQGGAEAQVPAEDEVPIDPALADHTAPVAPMGHNSLSISSSSAPAPPLVFSTAKKTRGAKKTFAASTSKVKSKAAGAAATRMATDMPTAADADDSDTTTPLASLQMLTGDRIWLLESILTYNPETPGSIPWEELARKAPHKQWTAKGLERA